MIRSFWAESSVPFGGGDLAQVRRLEKEFGLPLPPELAEYVANYAPASRYALETVGNPIDVYCLADLSSRAEGYNWNPLTQEVLDGWSREWLLLADEGADPIIVDLAAPPDASGSCPVMQAPHGEGEWAFHQLAPSLPVFMVLAAAQHHALTAFAPQAEAVSDDESGFNLNARAGEWYFPLVRRVAPDHYDMWAGVFDNA